MEVIEIACDESGFTGTNLLSAEASVFVHASVALAEPEAWRLVADVRDALRSTRDETKSSRLLKKRDRPVLEWFLRSPLLGQAYVELTDKVLFLVERVVDLLLGELTYASGTRLDRSRREVSLALHRSGPGTYGDALWSEFLAAAVDLMRPPKNGEAPLEPFFAVVERLRRTAADPTVEALAASRDRAEAFRAHLAEDARAMPALEPLLPSLVHTVLWWATPGGAVAVVHDEQSALTGWRVAEIQRLLQNRLLGVRQVDSRTDARVQLADLLAGAARRIVTDQAEGRGDRVLLDLLRPYVDGEAWLATSSQ